MNSSLLEGVNAQFEKKKQIEEKDKENFKRIVTEMGLKDHFFPEDEIAKNSVFNCEKCKIGAFCPDHKLAKAIQKRKGYVPPGIVNQWNY